MSAELPTEILSMYKLYNNWQVYYQTPQDTEYSYFFGYYDKSPLSHDSSKLLFHRVKFDGREQLENEEVEIGFVELKTNKITVIASTLAWNWQQGAQLQWLGPDFNTRFIYNTIQNGQLLSYIYDIEAKQTKKVQYSIYSVFSCGTRALSIDYGHLFDLRPGYNYINYGYSAHSDLHRNTSVTLVDLESGSFETILTLSDILEQHNLHDLSDLPCWIEHIDISPDQEKFSFFVRWSRNNTDFSRVFISNVKNPKQIYMLPDNKFYSHYSWVDNTNFSIWTQKIFYPSNDSTDSSQPSFANQLTNTKIKIKAYLSKFIPRFIFRKFKSTSKLSIFSEKGKLKSVIPLDSISPNGHQTWYRNGKSLLIDTYQDDKNFRKLFSYCTISQQLEPIGKFYSHYNDSTFRCDLHPHFDKKEKLIAIDSSHNTKRSILLLKSIS